MILLLRYLIANEISAKKSLARLQKELNRTIQRWKTNGKAISRQADNKIK